MSDVAIAFAQEMETMRDHLLLQAKKADGASVGGALRDRAWARPSTNSSAVIGRWRCLTCRSQTFSRRCGAMSSCGPQDETEITLFGVGQSIQSVSTKTRLAGDAPHERLLKPKKRGFWCFGFRVQGSGFRE